MKEVPLIVKGKDEIERELEALAYGPADAQP